MPHKDPEARRQYHRDYRRRNLDAHREKRAAALKQWRAANPEKRKKQARENSRRRREADPRAAAAANRKHRGLPEPTRTQPRYCECCASPATGRNMHLDHCHATGRFRGWLCTNCNVGIGNLGDNLVGVQRAMLYLRRNSPRVVEVKDDESYPE